jgi:hypothetical protein
MARAAGRQCDLDRLGFAGAELGQHLGIEARLPSLRCCRVEFDIARPLAPVILGNHGQLAVLAGIGLAWRNAVAAR